MMVDAVRCALSTLLAEQAAQGPTIALSVPKSWLLRSIRLQIALSVPKSWLLRSIRLQIALTPFSEGGRWVVTASH